MISKLITVVEKKIKPRKKKVLVATVAKILWVQYAPCLDAKYDLEYITVRVHS